MRIVAIKQRIDGTDYTVRYYGRPADGVLDQWVHVKASIVRTWPRDTVFELSDGNDYTGRELRAILKHLRYEFTLGSHNGWAVARSEPGESGQVLMSYPDIQSAWAAMDTLTDIEFALAQRELEQRRQGQRRQKPTVTEPTLKGRNHITDTVHYGTNAQIPGPKALGGQVHPVCNPDAGPILGAIVDPTDTVPVTCPSCQKLPVVAPR